MEKAGTPLPLWRLLSTFLDWSLLALAAPQRTTINCELTYLGNTDPILQNTELQATSSLLLLYSVATTNLSTAQTLSNMSSIAANDTLTPAEQAFNTAELLEQILSSFTLVQIHIASRVSRRWESIIEGSPTLRLGLFSDYRDDKNYQTEAVSPTYRVHHGRKTNSISSIATVPVYRTPITLNALVYDKNQTTLRFPYAIESFQPWLLLPYYHGPVPFVGRYTRTYVRHHFSDSSEVDPTEASWRTLYLTSPPITDVVIRIQTDLSSDEKYYQVDVHAEEGITLGVMCDRVETKLRQIPIFDSRKGASKRKSRPPTLHDFLCDWGVEEHPMFIVDVKDAKDIRSDCIDK